MGTLIQFSAQNHFGDCPKCQKNDGHINVGRDHWFVCRRHRVKWKAGHDIFPDWQHETLQVWRRNEKLLDLFMEVEPLQTWKSSVLEEIFAASREQAKPSPQAAGCQTLVLHPAKPFIRAPRAHEHTATVPESCTAVCSEG